MYKNVSMHKETKVIIRERVLPCYKKEKREKGKTSDLDCTQSNTDLWQGDTLSPTVTFVSLVNFQTARKMTS